MEADRGNAILTVVGSDKVGIIARLSVFLADLNVNITEINQTILSGNFVMMMMVDMTGSNMTLEDLKSELASLGRELGVSISIIHEQVFTAMHRV